ncbi:glutathione S-transferase [Sphingomonas sp. DBB INV C78]|uniref:glutathione S-transferase n=1 Tax=Sphingomonas sp. DBB INV C78 TaxID=3349434 RepID=UPI0036D25115
MADYDLYYWPLPFRGQFIRAILAYAGMEWLEHDAGEIDTLMKSRPEDQPIPFMGPPVLVERRSGFALAEMPAIALHLGSSLELMPATAELRALTAKIINDANDVIDEITLDGGREMWTEEKWAEFVPRLKRWMAIWEVTGKRHGLQEDGGFLLGTPEAGVADIVTTTLWATMSDRFSVIAKMLAETAPRTAELSRRLQEHGALKALNRMSLERYGRIYCGGDIEESLRKVICSQPTR